MGTWFPLTEYYIHDLGPLHRCIKKEADLDEDMAQTVLEEVETFVKMFESLTVQFQLCALSTYIHSNASDLFEALGLS